MIGKRVFQRELCDLTEARRMLEYRRTLIRMIDKSERRDDPSMVESRKKYMEEAQMLAWVCGEAETGA